MKTEVWGGSSILTPRGIEEYEATFTNLHPRHFSYYLKDIDDYMEVRVKRINVPGKREEVVTLPKYPVNGSHFGTCTCGAAQTNAVLCEHMSVIACCKPSDQPRDAAQREECSDLDEKSFNYFCRCDGRAKGIC